MSTKTVKRKSVVLHEAIGYLPTYIVDDKAGGDGTCTLFCRWFKVLRLPSGRYRTDVKADVMEFPDAAKMTRWIEIVKAFELPAEADGNPRFVPDDLRLPPSLRQLLRWA